MSCGPGCQEPARPALRDVPDGPEQGRDEGDMCPIRSRHLPIANRSLDDLPRMFNSVVQMDQLLRTLLQLPVALRPPAAQRPLGAVGLSEVQATATQPRAARDGMAAEIAQRSFRLFAHWRLGSGFGHGSLRGATMRDLPPARPSRRGAEPDCRQRTDAPRCPGHHDVRQAYRVVPSARSSRPSII
jgi:hypothetical protein